MKGLELSEKFFNECAVPEIQKKCPDLFENAAFGLVGGGSECYGFDDDTSRDHDWGPGFCIWLPKEKYSSFYYYANQVYQALPKEYEGFKRQNVTAETADRVGVLCTEDFYAKNIGRLPQDNISWMIAPQTGLSTVTNGKVFTDNEGSFSTMRKELLSYYPDDVALKKLAAYCALAAQSGQYNYSRCRKHGEDLAAMQALYEFVGNVQSIVCVFNKCYKPYYKWTDRMMRNLPVMGAEVSGLLHKLITEDQKEPIIEEISAMIIKELKARGLSDSESDFMLNHAPRIQEKISDDRLRSMHIMWHGEK